MKHDRKCTQCAAPRAFGNLCRLHEEIRKQQKLGKTKGALVGSQHPYGPVLTLPEYYEEVDYAPKHGKSAFALAADVDYGAMEKMVMSAMAMPAAPPHEYFDATEYAHKKMMEAMLPPTFGTYMGIDYAERTVAAPFPLTSFDKTFLPSIGIKTW